MQIILLIFIFKVIYCDWISEWLSPVEYQYKDVLTQNQSNAQHLNNRFGYIEANENKHKSEVFQVPSQKLLRLKLEEILRNAKILETTLKDQITHTENQERILKEAIASGRSGITVLTVTSLAQNPRKYFIRDGFWTLCNGFVQCPVTDQPYNMFTELFSSPRCIGQEITAKRDPCAFNSIIKYETVPISKRSTYIEDDYLCLKPSFNSTLETYMSVPRRIVDETCKNGVIKTLPENILECGLRVLLEYVFYPNRSQTSNLPLEYCTDKDGACKLMVAWHLSNTSIENFEFLKIDKNFKNFFIKNDHNQEPFI